MITYSIIIPYRDSYSMLLTALASIPDREDIQIIIVDNSVEPLAEEKYPQKKNAEIKMMRSDPTKGAGHARNIGLTGVKGLQIIFCDGDDYFTSNAFDIFDSYKDKGYDIVYFEADSIRLKTGEPSTRNALTNNLVEKYLETGDEDGLRYGSGVPWCKMFNAQFVKDSDIHFGETRVSNDALFAMYTGHAAKKITADSRRVYVVTEGEPNTSLTKIRSAENQFIRFQVALERFNFLTSIGKQHMCIYPWVFILQAWREFGFSEARKYYKYAKSQGVKVSHGFGVSYFTKKLFTKKDNK